MDLKTINYDDLRNQGDPKADEFVKSFFSNPDKKKLLDESLKTLVTNSDWDLFITQIPEATWFDGEFDKVQSLSKKTISKANQFFNKRKEYILQLLGLLSLPYCYAAADGAKVLFATERMYKDVHQRLTETAEFVNQIMDLKAFNQNGKGKVALFKVRVMHAAARFYLLKSGWDYSLGYPINQEDMLGTNLSFSLIVIRGLRKMGFAVNEEEQFSYISYWSAIGAALGIDENDIPKSGKQAHDIELQISNRQFKKSEEGVLLTKSLLNCFYKLNNPERIKNEEIPSFMRFLLGNHVADLLDLPCSTFPRTKELLLKIKVGFES